MPQIKPFKGLRPHPDYLKEVVAKPFEEMFTLEAKEIALSNKHSFLNLMEPVADHQFLRGTKQDIIFKKINENFSEFIEDKILIEDEKECFYIYQNQTRETKQTGIWATSAIDDYLNNTIRKHEHTREEREKGIIDYLEQTGIDSNPVLITYLPNSEIKNIISSYITKKPEVDFYTNDGVKHRLWLVKNEYDISTLISLFNKMDATYIADGHHRAAAASVLGIHKRKLNLKHTGKEDYNFFSTLLFSTDELLIFEYNRLIKGLNSLKTNEFLNAIEKDFIVKKHLGKPFKPFTFRSFGMYLDHIWYHLTPKNNLLIDQDPVSLLDVSILQNHILKPILGIDNPRSDERIFFSGGVKGIEDLEYQVNSGKAEVAFSLYPTSISQLIEVANAGLVMPPKSTWFEPKLHCGLVVHRI